MSLIAFARTVHDDAVGRGVLIYLVGSGPGDPGLFTLKGLECLKEADAVVYDRLVPKSLLEHASPEAELVYVGKEPGNPSMSQEEITPSS